jgi:FixJ family two-component response regulator
VHRPRPAVGSGTVYNLGLISFGESCAQDRRTVTPGKVLIVDDDDGVRRALRRLLCAAGYEVVVFPCAAAFLQETVPPPPACLLLDVRMPGMTGLELQRRIAGTPADMPVVFITAYGAAEVQRQARPSSPVAVLEKPLDERALLAAIERALDLSRTPCHPDAG